MLPVNVGMFNMAGVISIIAEPFSARMNPVLLLTYNFLDNVPFYLASLTIVTKCSAKVRSACVPLNVFAIHMFLFEEATITSIYL